MFQAFALLILLGLGVSCEEKIHPSLQKKNEVRALEVEEFGFSLQGHDDDGVKCETGIHNFKSLHGLCMGLQQPQPLNCALEERIQNFRKHCDKEYNFYEARRCDIRLKNPQGEGVGKASFCAGHQMSAYIEQSQTNENHAPLNDEYYAEASYAFVSKKITDKKTSMSISLFRDKNGQKEYVLKDFAFNKFWIKQEGEIEETGYKYIIDCRPTWSCDEVK